MEKLKITEGEWSVSGETKSFPILYIITASIDDKINNPFTLDVAHVLPKIRGKKENAMLIADAGTTYNKCNKLPSELMEENRELLEALKKSTEILEDRGFQEQAGRNIELLTKIENKE